jgi:hypothetical protein
MAEAPMEKIVSFVKWAAVLLGVVLVLWLPLVYSMHSLEKKMGKGHVEPTWTTMAENIRLMRYHGTNGLKITEDRVYIWRDRKWIQVLKRKPA